MPMRSKKQMSSSWMPMEHLTEDKAMLVLVRHGQSEWNFANRFIGWYDSPLTEEGQWEAEDAGRLLQEHKIEVDEVHTSMLDRTLNTARLALGRMRKAGLRVPADSELRSSWRLNERSYGALTGRNKKECTKEYGKAQLKLWRRSWDVPPPQYEDGCPLYQQETEAFLSKVSLLSGEGLYKLVEDPPPAELPRGESLKDTTDRLRPYWERTLLPALQKGRKVMVFGHENNLRALVKMMDGLDEEEILDVDIPRAMPMVYFFERETLLHTEAGIPRLKPIRLTPEDAAAGSEKLSARYLVKAELIEAFHQRDVMNVYDTTVEDNLEEVCVIDTPDSNMCELLADYHNDGGFDEDNIGLDDVRGITSDDLLGRVPSGEGKAAFLVPGGGRGPRRRAAAGTAPPRGARAAASRLEATYAGADAASSATVGEAHLPVGSHFAGAAAVAALLLLARRSSRRRSAAAGRPARAKGRGGLLARMAAEKSPEDQRVDDFYNIYNDIEHICAEHRNELECAIQEGAVSGAEEEICELLGYDLGETLIRQIGRSFTPEERAHAYRECGFETAKSSVQPQAIWLIGPSASGKSTLSPHMCDWVDITRDGYVTVDGEAFRECHMGYQDALVAGKQKGCVWWGAYVGIRENVNKEKQNMLLAAVREKKHMVIPSTCLRKSQCVDVAQMLLDNHYLVHIVGIYGDKQEIVARGQRRAKEKGKRYDPREFTLALQQFGPMLELCNGQYRMVCTTPGNSTAGQARWETTEEGRGPLSESQIKGICDRVLARIAVEA